MKKLLSIFLGAFLLGNYTQTFANPVPSIPGTDESFNHTIWTLKVAEKENRIVPEIISKLIMETGWTINPEAGCTISLPNSFNPNPKYNQLLDIEALGILKIDVIIYNNWGVQVAESSLVNRNVHNVFSKKSSLSQNDIKFYQKMKEGTYYYELNICCFNGEKTVKEGEIRLMKTQKK